MLSLLHISLLLFANRGGSSAFSRKPTNNVMAQIMADDGPSLPPPRVVDIGINLTHKAFRKHWKHVVKRAIDAGVDTILLTGTSIDRSKESLGLAQQWKDDEKCSNLFVTVGVHPHDANTWKSSGEEEQTTLEQMRKMLKHPLAVAVGECGLDYNRNFSSKPHQIHAFREQIRLACELNMPIFVHEREAHEDLILIVDQVRDENKERPLPPICIHCFTGTEQEALEYVKRGYYIGFTGTICKKNEGRLFGNSCQNSQFKTSWLKRTLLLWGSRKKDGVVNPPIALTWRENSAKQLGFLSNKCVKPQRQMHYSFLTFQTSDISRLCCCLSTALNAGSYVLVALLFLGSGA